MVVKETIEGVHPDMLIGNGGHVRTIIEDHEGETSTMKKHPFPDLISPGPRPVVGGHVDNTFPSIM